ncbi:a-pheromone processing metallopeptidase ste23 [Niveomyces insectorum RCEF 264]|uniref:A-pheromone processing metallopeptidase ste23 n=1 Tax=Niveomyces insectorum RCEF 264 TaxID=1081102 RepID=A0A167R9R4_9HYPO|nr:a-pheromone processing metallopeptidase ste23 [Niveomyces insectorum RCEF 264]
MSPSPTNVAVAPKNAQGKHASVKIITEALQKPSLDDRSYRVIELANGLEALLVHDAETDKASASLDVGVGNFNDYEDMPGIAHAVEHLLFMGTKKFPEENAYNQYLSSNSGGSNAYTSSTSTNYFFDVSGQPHNGGQASATNPSPLYGALDRFAQFFIEPLFLASTVDRELHAVDSENKKNLQNDQWRIHQLEKSLTNPKHPFCHFSTGNLEVLKVEPEARGINVREKFMEFHDKYYSANQMKLVVLGREPLDVLQDWVSELFSGVPNKNLPPNSWPDVVPYTPEYLGWQTFVKPVMDSRDLTLRFPFPDETLLYDSQPSRYISHLIGHEGPGSVMSYIKSKGWANSLGAGMYAVCAGTPGIFEVTIRLTEKGLQEYQEVVKVVFQYISLLRENPPQQWIFDEQKGMADVDFKFKQKTPASRFTSKTSALMQRVLPRERLLSGTSCLHKFDPELIQRTIDYLRPDNLRITVTSRTYPGDWNAKEKWYGTEYKEERIPSDFMAGIQQAYSVSKDSRIPQLHLPHKNQFVPTKLEVEKKEVKEPAPAPRIIRNDELARTWFKKDDTFWVPKGTLTVNIKNPIVSSVAENYIKTTLFTELVRDALEEYSYDADLAGLLYNVSLEMSALIVEVSGYNDKLPVLLEQVLVTMRDLDIKDDRFAIIKERTSRHLRNYAFQQPYHLLADYMSWLTTPSAFTVEELAQELPGVTADIMRRFAKELFRQIHMEIHVHGNFYKEDALKLTDMIESTFKPHALPRAQWPIGREVSFPAGSNYVFEKELEDKENVNHALEYVLHIGDRGDRAIRARSLLLDQLTQEPAWDQLRTKQQLGYVVFSGVRSGTATMGFRFLVQSEKVPQYLEERVDAFLTEYGVTLADMSDAAFEGHKRSLIVKRLEKPKNLYQETSRHWIQIHNEFYDFEFAQKDAAEIKLLTKADMIAFYNHYIHPESPARAKLAVHLLAQAKSDITTKQISDLVKGLDLGPDAAVQAATDLQARLTAAHHDEAAEVGGLKDYLTTDLQVAPGKVDAAVEAWKSLSSYHKTTNGVDHTDKKKAGNNNSSVRREINGTVPVRIENIRDFRASVSLTGGPRALTDISEFLDVDAKL